MHHFFLPPDAFTPTEVVFPPETARQIRSVLRLRPGALVLALDNHGSAYEVELSQVDLQSVRGQILLRAQAPGEPAVQLTLYLGLTQREKFEWMLQKCTEVGAAAFVPFLSSRSLLTDLKDSEKKQERWQRILQEAAEQSGRGRIPVLRPALKFEPALQQARTENDLALLAWEAETSASLSTVLSTARDTAMRIAILIGPEGGFSTDEIQQAHAAGMHPFHLGPRILRMETAAVVAAALVLHTLGENEIRPPR